MVDIFTYAPSHAKGKVEGLCGNFDGNMDNDLYPKGMNEIDPGDTGERPKTFVESYRYMLFILYFSGYMYISITYCS